MAQHGKADPAGQPRPAGSTGAAGNGAAGAGKPSLPGNSIPSRSIPSRSINPGAGGGTGRGPSPASDASLAVTPAIRQPFVRTSPHAAPAAQTPAAQTPVSELPKARGTIFVGFKQAVEGLWGAAGLRSVAQLLPVDVRYDTVDTVLVNMEWLPETHVLAWYEALWSGPCERKRHHFVTVIDRMMDCGFGRVRKALLHLASPSMIFGKAPGLWRYDHSHGELTIDVDGQTARVRLEDHPYTANPLSCMATAEIYRYCVALSRGRDVTESHYNDPSGALIVRIRWS